MSRLINFRIVRVASLFFTMIFILGLVTTEKTANAYTYNVVPTTEWDGVFNNTGHMGDGFQWMPIGVKNRQGLGTSTTKSAMIFNDSRVYVGGAWSSWISSTAGTYTGIAANTANVAWKYGTGGAGGNYNSMWTPYNADSGKVGTVAWNLVNNYGMSGLRASTDTHDNDKNKMYKSASNPSVANSYIIIDLFATKSLGSMYLWNYNEALVTNAGLKNFKVFTSTDGTTYTQYGATYQITQAGGTAAQANNGSISFAGTRARYVKITWKPTVGDGNWGNANITA
ncbi:discoidin domain-containing protein [Paenibacillus solisilvae]|uniref:Discoidin domain-containing protein n=1 Tax=Paenibacillus solisilvae TaxID=2486751 RepID=A0ABW0VYF6_9BACL